MADTRLTDEEIREGLVVCEAATRGPWRSTWDDPSVVARTPQDFMDADIAVESTAPGLTDTERRVVALVEYDGLNTSCTRENASLIAHAGTHYAAALRDLARLRRLERAVLHEAEALATVRPETWRGWLAPRQWEHVVIDDMPRWLPPQGTTARSMGFAERMFATEPARVLYLVSLATDVPRAAVLAELLAAQEGAVT